MQRVTRPSAVTTLPTPPASPSAPGFFSGGNATTGQAATVPGYEWFNAVQEELVSIALATGAPLTAGAYTQCLTVIQALSQGGAGNVAADIGSATAYQVTLTPTPTGAVAPNATPVGLMAMFQAAHANTGAATLNVNNMTAALVRSDGTALQQGDIVAGQLVVAVGVGTSWTALGLAGRPLYGAVDTGAVNALVVNPATPLPALVAFRDIKFQVGNTNTQSAVTLNVSGLGARTVLRSDGTALQPGDLVAGQIVSAVYNGAAWVLVASPGLTPAAIQAQSGNFAVDTGAVNALAVTLSPAPAALVAGLPVRVKSANTVTGASTLNVNGLGAVAIKRPDGTALQTGDVLANQTVQLVYDGTNFILPALPGPSPASMAAAIQAQAGNYAVDTGAANALVVAPTPAVTALVAGLTLRVQVKAANSGATTIAVSGLAAVAVHQQDGNPLQANALRPGGVFDLVYDGTAFQLQDGLFTGGYQVFTSSSTFTVPYGIYYLRVLTIGGGGGSAAATGNNGYPGTGGSAGGAMASGTYPVTPGQTITVTVGAAGLGGGSSLAAGTAGGTTSFGSLQSSTGGAPSTGTAGATSGGSVGGAQGLPSTAGGTQNASLLSLFTRASLAVGPGGGASSASYGGSNDGGGGGGGITLPGVTSPTGGAPAFSGTAPVGFGAGANGANGSYGYAAAGAQGAVYVEW